MQPKNIEQRTFIIYVLKDPESLEVRYVGVTCVTLGARLSQHIYDSKKGGSHKKNWILSLKSKPIIEEIERCDYLNWENREIYWISYYKNLTNTKVGGAGIVLNRKEDSIKKSSEAKYKTVIAIDENRNVLRFKSHSEASKKLGVPENSINYSTSNLNYCSYGYNFIKEKDYKPGLENTVSLSKKKEKFKVKYKGEMYSILGLSKHLNISETTAYLWCTGHTNWKKAHKLKGEQIEIFKI